MNEQNVYSLAEHLLQTVNNNVMGEDEMMNYLKNLQEECLKMNESSDMDRTAEGDSAMTSKEVSFDGVGPNISKTSGASDFNQSTDLDYTNGSLTDVTALDRNVNSISNQENFSSDISGARNQESLEGGADKRRKFEVEYSTSRTFSDEILGMSTTDTSHLGRTDLSNTVQQHLGFSRTAKDSRFDVEYSTSKSQTNFGEASTSNSSGEKDFEMRFQRHESSNSSSFNESSCNAARFYSGLSVKRKLS